MGKKRVRHSAEFKARVALEALKGLKTERKKGSKKGSILFVKKRERGQSYLLFKRGQSYLLIYWVTLFSFQEGGVRSCGAIFY